MFDLASGAAPAPPATADSATRSQWLTRDAAARLAIRNHLPLAECAHFGQHMIAQALYDAVVARYSLPATAALGRLLLPYLFPELSAFTTVEDLVSHLRTSDARYRTTVPAEDHYLSLDPTSLTVDLLEQHLLAAETSAIAVGAARGTPCPPFFEGCSPSPLAPSYAFAAAADVPSAEDVGAASASAKRRSGKGKGSKRGGGGSGGGGGGSSGGGGGSGGGSSGGSGGGGGGVGGGGGGSSGSGGSGGSGIGGGGTSARREGPGGGQRQRWEWWQWRRWDWWRWDWRSAWRFRRWLASAAAMSDGCCPYVICMGERAGQTCGKLHTQHRCFSRLDDAWCAEFGADVELPRWADLLTSRIAIFDLDFDAILSAMYTLSVSAEGDTLALTWVLQRFGFQFSSPQPIPLSTSHSLSAPPLDESVEPCGPYPELVGCLMYLMTCTRPDLAYPLSLLARYVAPGRHRKVHWDAAKRVLRYSCSTSGMGLVLGGRGPVVLTGHAEASWVDDSATQQSSKG
ncbi:unnamed protein product [Closterium sp. NIES-53]